MLLKSTMKSSVKEKKRILRMANRDFYGLLSRAYCAKKSQILETHLQKYAEKDRCKQLAVIGRYLTA